MSIKMTARVWALNDPELEGARLLTLLSLADHANSDDQSWPSIPTIAKRTRVSERQIQRSIQWLEEHGYIKISEKGNGRGKTTLYNMLLKGDIGDKKGDMVSPISEELTPVNSEKGDISDEKGDIGDANYSHALREPKQQPIPEKGERAAPPLRVLPSGVNGAKQVRISSPHLDLRHFVNGFVPPGTGASAVEVYYERFSINLDAERLSNPLEDDLMFGCKDLDLLREVIVAYHQSPHRRKNIKLILDWYNDPSRFRNGHNGNHKGTSTEGYQRPETSKHSMAEHRAVAAERKAAGLPY